MKKVSFTLLISTLIACGGSAGLVIDDPPQTGDPPISPTIQRFEDSSVNLPADAFPPGEDTGALVDAGVVPNLDAGEDAHADTGEDAQPERDTSVPDTSTPVADAEPDAVVIPPTCRTRGSCTASATQCYEYEDNAVLLPQHQASCTGVWAFAPCNRAQWVGACEVVLTGESACPKARYVYSTPVTPAQIMSSCANKGGTVIMP